MVGELSSAFHRTRRPPRAFDLAASLGQGPAIEEWSPRDPPLARRVACARSPAWHDPVCLAYTTYRHVLEARQREVARGMDAVLGG
jgi:hypothetical protein